MSHYDLIAAKLEQAKSDHLRELTRELTRQLYSPLAFPGPPSEYWYKPPSRWRRAYWRVRGYCSTLWLALRGRELVEPTEGDW